MILFCCQDKDGRIVFCSNEIWEGHIVSEHPEMKGCETIVQATIQSPYRIYQDAIHPRRRVLYKPFVLPKPFNTQFLRVVIEYKSKRFKGIVGNVITAFSCAGIRQGDILLWENKL